MLPLVNTVWVGKIIVSSWGKSVFGVVSICLLRMYALRSLSSQLTLSLLGGPEIVALCNALRRPIHVYELHSHRKQFMLRRMACFGSPKFDRREPLHILSADSRFPDVSPGKQIDSGNHFLAVFPESHRVARKAGVRGGDNLICRGEPHARWKFATWLAVWWSTFSGFWMKPKWEYISHL